MDIFLGIVITALLVVFIVDCSRKRRAFLAEQKVRHS